MFRGGKFGWVSFVVVCFLYKTNPNPRKKEKKVDVGKNGPNDSFSPNFSWVGLVPWVGEFVGFITILVRICFPTREDLVHREHLLSLLPIVSTAVGERGGRGEEAHLLLYSSRLLQQ